VGGGGGAITLHYIDGVHLSSQCHLWHSPTWSIIFFSRRQYENLEAPRYRNCHHICIGRFILRYLNCLDFFVPTYSSIFENRNHRHKQLSKVQRITLSGQIGLRCHLDVRLSSNQPHFTASIKHLQFVRFGAYLLHSSHLLVRHVHFWWVFFVIEMRTNNIQSCSIYLMFLNNIPENYAYLVWSPYYIII